MPSGSRRQRTDEYVFIDGRAVRADELQGDASVPGQQEAQSERGSANQKGDSLLAHKRRLNRSRSKGGASEKAAQDAQSMAGGSLSLAQSDEYRRAERRKMRAKYLAFGIVLLVLVLFSLCISDGYYGKLYSPVEVAQCYGAWFHVAGTALFDPVNADRVYFQTMQQLPMYNDVIYTFLAVFKYVICGILLAVSGMLYQNTFRNPIAAPSMLGVSNGINTAILVLILQFGYNATQMMGLYFLYSYLGGALVLGLVMLGGKYISGKGNFNVVNMLLIGTIVSQMLGVILTYAQNMVLDEASWDAYYLLQTATGLDTVYTYISLAACTLIGFIPIIALRFRLNLVAFDDAEVRMLGVNADALRILALVCGSFMILTAQINAGQVSMLSLVVPFVVRAVFGAEFRKQLIGNVLCGAIVLLVAGDFVSYFTISGINLELGSVVTVFVLPLFVWMISARQRSWE